MTDQNREQASEDTLRKYDVPTLRSIEGEQALSAASGIPRALFIPQSYGEALEIAKMMCAGIGVPAYLRGSPANCMAVLMQASRWGLDPYAVASKSYFVNDMIAYESQLVNAVVNTSGVLHGRLKLRWSGQDNALRCVVEGHIKGDDEVKALAQSISRITVKNSPLWKVNPEQQLGYYTTRAWARLYIPEVLLGVYTPEEVQAGLAYTKPAEAVLNEGSALPAAVQAADAPRRSDYNAEPVQERPQERRAAAGPRTGQQAPAEQQQKAAPPVERTIGPVPEGFDTWDAWGESVMTKLKIAPTLVKLDAVTNDAAPLFEQAPDEVRAQLSELYELRAEDHRSAAS